MIAGAGTSAEPVGERADQRRRQVFARLEGHAKMMGDCAL